MMVGKIIFLLNWMVFRFHVNLPGCIYNKQRKLILDPPTFGRSHVLGSHMSEGMAGGNF